MNQSKNRLWAFGDSFTYGYMCRLEEKESSYLNYKKEGDDIWVNHLSKIFNYQPLNFGKNGASNDFIFENIIDNFENIQENDIVIIGKTNYGRNNFPKNKKWHDVSSDLEIKFMNDWWDSFFKKTFTKEETQTIFNFQYHFGDNNLYKIRHDNRFEFIKNRLINEKKVRNCYIWQIQNSFIKNFQRISDATKYKINDYHFSFKGHLDFANFLKQELVSENNKRLL